MRHIFIDLGAGDGDTIRQFRNWKSLAYDSDIKWEMYGFDPDPRNAKLWKNRPEKDTTFSREAAWIKSGTTQLRMSEDSLSSTIMKEKDMSELETKKCMVYCFDFSEWLRQFENDHVIIKMDIEGAELPILTKMINDGTDYIPELTLVEFHDGKMPKYDSNKKWILENYRSRLVEYR